MAEKSINTSAFGENIVVQRRSTLRSVFRDEIPNPIFKIAVRINDVVTIYETTQQAIDAGYANIVGGEVILIAPPNTGDITLLFSRRHPVFHPDLGKRNSPSVFYDTYTNGDHEIGFANFDDSTLELRDSITFQLKNNIPKGRIFSLGVEKSFNNIIDQSLIDDCDIIWNKGHLFDIQAQLRNVGNIYWFLSSVAKEGPREVLQYYGLNKQSNITVSSPALHAVFIVRNNAGVRSQMRIGCLDVSNEGQDEDIEHPVIFDNTEDVTNCDANGVVLMAIKVPYQYKGVFNTRDSTFYEASILSDKRGKVKMFLLPNDSRLTLAVGTVWTQKNDASLQYIDNGGAVKKITSVNLTGLDAIGKTGLDAGVQGYIRNPDPRKIPQYLTHGEVIVFVGYGSPAAAAMNLTSAYLGEGI